MENNTESSDKKRMLLLEDSRGFYKVLNANKSEKFKWKKDKIDTKSLQSIDLPNYLIVRKGKLEQYITEQIAEETEKIIGNQQDKQVQENNMEIIQTEEGVQKLDPDQIELLKKRDQAENLIDKIASNNVNFDKRTKFSKQKYKEKKKKKYMTVFKVDQVKLRNINGKTFIISLFM